MADSLVKALLQALQKGESGKEEAAKLLELYSSSPDLSIWEQFFCARTVPELLVEATALIARAEKLHRYFPEYPFEVLFLLMAQWDLLEKSEVENGGRRVVCKEQIPFLTLANACKQFRGEDRSIQAKRWIDTFRALLIGLGEENVPMWQRRLKTLLKFLPVHLVTMLKEGGCFASSFKKDKVEMLKDLLPEEEVVLVLAILAFTDSNAKAHYSLWAMLRDQVYASEVLVLLGQKRVEEILAMPVNPVPSCVMDEAKRCLDATLPAELAEQVQAMVLGTERTFGELKQGHTTLRTKWGQICYGEEDLTQLGSTETFRTYVKVGRGVLPNLKFKGNPMLPWYVDGNCACTHGWGHRKSRAESLIPCNNGERVADPEALEELLRDPVAYEAYYIFAQVYRTIVKKNTSDPTILNKWDNILREANQTMFEQLKPNYSQ